MNGNATTFQPIVNGNATTFGPMVNGNATTFGPMVNGNATTFGPMVNGINGSAVVTLVRDIDILGLPVFWTFRGLAILMGIFAIIGIVTTNTTTFGSMVNEINGSGVVTLVRDIDILGLPVFWTFQG